MNLFDPSAAAKRKAEGGRKRKAQADVKQWVKDLLPDDIKAEVATISVREVQCGDPGCSPIDTAIQVMFSAPSKRPMVAGLPMECTAVTQQHVQRAVAEMLAEEAEPEFDPISASGQQVYDSIVDDLFSRMDNLSFSDRMGVCQRLFANIEEYEQRVMQYQAAMMRRNQSQQSPQQNMLLSYAQQNQPAEIERLLAEGGLDASAGNSVGQTALHVAALWGNAAAARCLIAHQVRQEQAANKQQLLPPSKYHCSSPPPAPATTTHNSHTAWKYTQPSSPSFIAFFSSLPSFCRSTRRAQADVNKPNNLTGGTPMHIVVTSPKELDGRLASAKLLLDAGADITLLDARGNTALDYASERRLDEPQMLALIREYAAAATAAPAAANDEGEDDGMYDANEREVRAAEADELD